MCIVIQSREHSAYYQEGTNYNYLQIQNHFVATQPIVYTEEAAYQILVITFLYTYQKIADDR